MELVINELPLDKTLSFRIHTEFIDNLDEFVMFLRKHNDVYLIVREVGKEKRQHLHIALKFKKTLSTFRQQILKMCPRAKGVGNGAYSIRQVTELEPVLRYFCKGENGNKPDIVFAVENLDIEMLHNLFWSINKEMKSKTEGNMGCQNGTSVEKKVKTKSWLEKLYDDIIKEFSVECNTIVTYQYYEKAADSERRLYDESRRIIFRHFVKCLGKAVKKFGTRTLQEMFDGIINAIIQNADDVAGGMYADRIYSQIYG